MKRRIISFALSLALLLTLLPHLPFSARAETYSGTCGANGDNLTWTLDTHTGILTIEGNGAMKYYSASVPPPWCNYKSSIHSVILQNGVTHISACAFEDCNYLTNVTIPDSVTSIGMAAFDDCTRLNSVFISDLAAWCQIDFDYSISSSNPLSYAHNLYLNNQLVTDLNIPDGVTSIGNWAFLNCSSLTSVTIPGSVTSIGHNAFGGCTSLTSVTIGNGVTRIGDYMFHDCSSLTSVTIPDSVTRIGISAFSGCTSLTSVTIGNGVTRIDDYAFCFCSSLTSLTIPGSVTNIGSCSFSSCSSLTSVTIPGSVTSIGSSAFSGCTSLTSVTIGNGVTRIGDYMFDDCSSLTSVTIPDSVTKIGYAAFECCSSLTSVTIGNGVTRIDVYAFCDCSSLTSVTIPDSVTIIAYKAFERCSSLTSVTIGNGVTRIEGYAFCNCGSLTSVTIPESVSYIDVWAFGYMYDFITLEATAVEGFTIYGYTGTAAQTYAEENGFPFIPIDLSNASSSGIIREGSGWALRWECSYFEDCDGNKYNPRLKLYMDGVDPEDSWKFSVSLTDPDQSPWLAATGFARSDFISISVLGTAQNPIYIVNSQFKGYTSVKTVELSHICTVDTGTFEGCTALETVSGLDNDLYSFAPNAFKNCSALRQITIPDTVINIGENAFYGCVSITYISIPGGVTNLSNGAFWGCSSLSSVTIQDGVERIGEKAFFGCSALTSVVIPEGVATIGEGAFEGTSLNSVLIMNPACLVDGWDLYNEASIYTAGDPERTHICSDEGSAVQSYAERYGYAFGHSYVNDVCVYCHMEKPLDLRIYNDGVPIATLSKPLEDYLCDIESTELNYDLAFYLCALSRAAYHKEDMKKSLKSLGFSWEDIFWSSAYQADDTQAAYSLAKKSISEGTLVLITIRGTWTDLDKLTDLDLGVGTELFAGNHEGFMRTVNDIFTELKQEVGESNVGNNNNITYVITGHSLGAGIGNLLAVALSDAGVPNNKVYNYNFACPDVAKKNWRDWNPNGIHDNIINICNRKDIVTQLPGVAAGVLLAIDHLLFTWGKYGQTKWFTTDYGKFDFEKNHDAETYLRALEENTTFYDNSEDLNCDDDRTLFVARCPVDITVYDAAGKAIASVIDDRAVYYDANFGEAIILTYGDQKAIAVPRNQEYQVEITSTGDGEMSYEIYDIDFGDRNADTDKMFTSVNLTEGKRFVSAVSESDDMPEIQLFVVNDTDDHVAEILGDGTELPLDIDNPFLDVKEGKYYYKSVLWAYFHVPQITSGTGEGTFSPGNTCTREQIVTFLWSAYGAPEPNLLDNPFSDVKSNKYYFKAVLWAVENGITSGIGDGKFGVGQGCTRAQAMTFLWIAAGKPAHSQSDNPFSDVKPGKYYYDAILWAVENGVTSGVGDGKFGVGQTCTRAQIVTFLYKTFCLF